MEKTSYLDKKAISAQMFKDYGDIFYKYEGSFYCTKIVSDYDDCSQFETYLIKEDDYEYDRCRFLFGDITEKDYDKIVVDRREKYRLEMQKRQEEVDRKTYENLKKKFEK